MKIYLLLALSFCLIGCKQKEDKIIQNTPVKPYGNLKTKLLFEKHYKEITVKEDTLVPHPEIASTLKRLDYSRTLLSEYTEGNIYYSEVSRKLSNNISLHILKKDDRLTDYIYTHDGKPFAVHNYYDDFYGSDSNIFFLDDGTCSYYLIANKVILSKDHPALWCGLASNFAFYQIIDLNRMEIIQFVDRYDLIK